MNDKLTSRLVNWKFQQALQYLEGEPQAVQELVHALALLVGDCGHGLGGALEVVISAALASLPDEEERPHGDADLDVSR